MTDFRLLVERAIEASSAVRIFVHTDLIRGFRLQLTPNEGLLDAHCRLLLEYGREIYMPTFNYDFLKTKKFDVQNTPSKIGVINEYFRSNYAQWQTPVPVFSVAGTGPFPEINYKDEIDPFDESSIFGFLYRTNSLVMYYGANFSSSTLVHYVERISNLLYYRYDKLFDGELVANGISNNVTLKYHVRPMGRDLIYDWVKLENDLKQNNLIRYFEERATKIGIVRVTELVDFWMMKMNQDPLYLLNMESRMWIQPLLDKLGRRFHITDFE